MDKIVPISREVAQEAVRVAKAVLSGSIGVIEGARKMASIHLYAGHWGQPLDKDYLFFFEIDQRTNHLPLGDTRKYWATEALAKKDAEFKELEASYREQAFKAAEGVIRRHGQDN